MLIAHRCTACKVGTISLFVNKANLYLCSCGHIEDNAAFWVAYNRERYCSELENEIENRFPFRSISILGNVINLAVGWHVLGRFEARDLCIDGILKDAREIYDKWQICYCDFSKIDKRIAKFEESVKDNSKESVKYAANLKTVKAAFADLSSRMKELYK